MYTYPRPQNLAYPARVLSGEGRFMRRSEAGQSESWPEGQPEGRCGAWGRASQARTWEALGFRPALKKGSATVIWLDGDRRAARKRRAQGPYGVCQVPGRTDQGFKTPRWSVRKAHFVTTKARRSALHLPSKSTGDQPKA